MCFRFYLTLDENSILEVAVHPSYSNFFLETWQKRLIWHQRMPHVATGCITILQAVNTPNYFEILIRRGDGAKRLNGYLHSYYSRVGGVAEKS